MAFKWSSFSRRNSKKNTSRVWRIGKIKMNKTLRVPVIVFSLILIYGAVSFIVNHYNPIRTTSAVQIVTDDSFSTTGYFIRE